MNAHSKKRKQAKNRRGLAYVDLTLYLLNAKYDEIQSSRTNVTALVSSNLKFSYISEELVEQHIGRQALKYIDNHPFCNVQLYDLEDQSNDIRFLRSFPLLLPKKRALPKTHIVLGADAIKALRIRFDKEIFELTYAYDVKKEFEYRPFIKDFYID